MYITNLNIWSGKMKHWEKNESKQIDRLDKKYGQGRDRRDTSNIRVWREGGMKYFKTLNIYKNSSGSLQWDPVSGEGYSYKWYRLSQRCKNYRTQIVLNTYGYSPTTLRHAYKLKLLIHEATGNWPIQIEAPEGLQNKEAAIKHYENLIDELKSLIDKPRTKAAKNKERQDKIWEYTNLIGFIKGEL